MACQGTKIKGISCAAISSVTVAFCLMIIPAAFAQQTEANFLTVERKVLTKTDGMTPVKGYRISPSDIGADGHNFEYCDGTTGQEDLELFSHLGERCDLSGWAMKLDHLQKELGGAVVYANDPINPGYVAVGVVSPDASDPNRELSEFVVDFYEEETGAIWIDLKSGADDVEILKSYNGEWSVYLGREYGPNLDQES